MADDAYPWEADFATAAAGESFAVDALVLSSISYPLTNDSSVLLKGGGCFSNYPPPCITICRLRLPMAMINIANCGGLLFIYSARKKVFCAHLPWRSGVCTDAEIIYEMVSNHVSFQQAVAFERGFYYDCILARLTVITSAAYTLIWMILHDIYD